MKNILISILILTAIPVSGQSFWAYDEHGLSLEIPEISLLTVMPANHVVNLELGLPQNAGSKPGENQSSTDDDTWLNYTCCMAPGSGYRKVFAQISSGSIPNGIDIQLEVGNLSNQGKGKCGVRYTDKVNLSYSPKVVIHQIGGSCTYRGVNYGHQLTYSLKLKDIDDLILDEPKTYLTVTYTISD